MLEFHKPLIFTPMFMENLLQVLVKIYICDH